MPKWIVQRLSNGERNTWRDIAPPGTRPFDPGIWEAPDAGQAFNEAVLKNEWEKLKACSYRVLPYEGGVTINLEVNVNAVEHDAKV